MIMALYDLTEQCDYKDIKGGNDQRPLIVGIRDSVLLQKLQLNSPLTLGTAEKKVRQREAVHEQQQMLTGADSTLVPAVSMQLAIDSRQST